MKNKGILFGGMLLICVFAFGGCETTKGNIGNMPSYKIPLSGEAEWLRNGDPIEFEGELWYPQDRVNVLIDAEVHLMGEYKGVQFFIEKIDVRPYNRLYTKFANNKYRIFTKRYE